MEKKEVGNRIRTYMKQNGLTQEKVADDLRLKQSSVSGMISGKRDTIRLAIDMADYYKVPRETFLGEDIPLSQAIAKRDITENGLSTDEKFNLVHNLEELYRKHQQLLDDASQVMKEIAAINKLLIIGNN